jgi:hypothetical protein
MSMGRNATTKLRQSVDPKTLFANRPRTRDS